MKTFLGVMCVQKFKNPSLAIMSILILLITTLTNFYPVYVNAEDMHGDLDNSGNVNSIDFAVLRQYLLGITELDNRAMRMADLNVDGSANSIDFAILRQFLLGQIVSLPVQTASTLLPSKKDVLDKMVLANNYFLIKYPSPSAKADPTHEGNIWTKGTYLQGVMALHRINSDPSLYKYAVDWATYFNWNARDGNRTTNADNQCCMQTYIDLYQIEPEDVRLNNTIACMDNMVRSTSVSYWSWIDAMYMSMPVLVDLSIVKGDTKYSEKAYELYNYTKTTAGFYNKSNNLWWRDASFKGSNVYWSRGNGWVFAAHAKVLSLLPETDPHYEEYKTTFIEMAEALKDCQREDGFWNPDLLNQNNHGGKETSGTAFFTYGMAWGINAGILDSDVYLPCVLKGWNGMAKDALHTNGFLGWVQGTGKQPSDGQPLSYTKVPNFEDYGLGAFLLAGSEVYKLAQ